MILDAGIALFYHAATQKPGGMPSRDGTLFHRCWYGERTVGIQRYYTAKQYDDRADLLIRILQVQFLRDDEAGEDVCDLTLERIGDNDVGKNGP